MVKFSRELEAQLIPEWKDAFVNYRQLKKHVKKIKLSFFHSQLRSKIADAAGDEDIPKYGFSIFDHFRRGAGFSPKAPRGHCDFPIPTDEDNAEQMEPVQSKAEEENGFFNKLEKELEKVNNFYKAKEREFCQLEEALSKQLRILIDLKQILVDHHRRRHSSSLDPYSANFLSRFNSSPFSDLTSEVDDTISEGSSSPISEEVIAALERNGISFVGSVRSTKAKKGMKPKAATMRIDIPATTPGKTIAAITSMVWEDFVNGARKDGDGAGGGDYISRKKIECAEKMIRGAFVELYRGLGLLKTYSSLNIVAFTKILKKYDKVSNKQTSSSHLKKVKRSHFASSDKVVKLVDDVESIFIKHFATNDRKKAMKFLRPNQPKESHMITFFVGLFTGSFVTLFTVYAILAHMSGIFSTTSKPGYMETVYPVFSMFALLSLHIFLYGCNLFMWKSSRINHNFIFEFNPKTALKYRDAFLICASFMTMVVGAMVIHLILRSSNLAPNYHLIDAIPATLLVFYLGILICPFNILYRSTRYCFMRVLRNIIFSPFYKVLMVDFFMADQLTSQIPMLRYMEFTSCYFIATGFKIHPYETCSNSKQYRLISYIISFLPYYCRAMQCARRYMEEGYDLNHVANAGKYVSAMLAAAVRLKYAVDPSPMWLVIVLMSSTVGTLYQLYWDFVKDWGLLNLYSKNLFLRDDLILKNKCIYYVSIALNFVLRLAWIETVLRLNLGAVENRLVDFLLASLEIIRRGHWNFYRLENEHLNNVGKFRAVKAVPLPFRYM